MSIESELHARSASACELCGASESLVAYSVPPVSDVTVDNSVLLCGECCGHLDTPSSQPQRWRCLGESMWSEVPAVQVLAWRVLDQLGQSEGWAQELLETLFLEDEVQTWAEAVQQAADAQVKHLDAHGAVLLAGNTVTLIKDLDVKGGGFTAKRGTVVKGIALVESNAEHIEGRVSGQRIVILTKFVKKSGQ